MVNFDPPAADIAPVVWGITANFYGFRILTALMHCTVVVGVSQTVRRWTEGATYIRQGGHDVGHWSTFLVEISWRGRRVPSNACSNHHDRWNAHFRSSVLKDVNHWRLWETRGEMTAAVSVGGTRDICWSFIWCGRCEIAAAATVDIPGVEGGVTSFMRCGFMFDHRSR